MISKVGWVAVLGVALPGPLLAEWYSGGDLHDSTLSEWNAATAENRLATSSDFAVGALGEERSVALGLDRLRIVAGELANCISEVAVEPGAGSQKSTEIAAACWILMTQ